MSEKPLHSGTNENGFKKPDRTDRHGKHTGENLQTDKPSGFAPNPNDDSHKPKIVPWK